MNCFFDQKNCEAVQQQSPGPAASPRHPGTSEGEPRANPNGVLQQHDIKAIIDCKTPLGFAARSLQEPSVRRATLGFVVSRIQRDFYHEKPERGRWTQPKQVEPRITRMAADGRG